MHELSVSQSILNICLDEGKKHNVKKVKEINIVVGELTGLVPSCISYYFDIISKGTIADGAKLNVEYTPVNIACNSCGYSGVMKKGAYKCPSCSNTDYKITKGNEFYLNTMEVD